MEITVIPDVYHALKIIFYLFAQHEKFEANVILNAKKLKVCCV